MRLLGTSAFIVGLMTAACGSDPVTKGSANPAATPPVILPGGAAGAASGAGQAGRVATAPGLVTPPASSAAGSPASLPNTGPVITPPTLPAAGAAAPAGAAGAKASTPGDVTPPAGVAGAPGTPPGGAPGSVPGTTPGGTTAPGAGSPGEPVIPAVSGECPEFRNGTINFMGLGGIQVVAGTKASSPTAPIVFYWHGTGSFSGEFASMAAAVQQGVVKEGGVLISFQGSTGGDLLSGTNIFGKGDFNLTDQLLACAVKNHNVDPKRVFATGCSAGGLFSVAMGTVRSAYMAAVASNSGGWTFPLQFESMHTPPLMTVHGAAGLDVVIVDFSETSATADMGFKQRGALVINCNHMGGHCGGAGQAPSIWEFFKAHPFGVSPEPWASGLPSGFDKACKIF